VQPSPASDPEARQKTVGAGEGAPGAEVAATFPAPPVCAGVQAGPAPLRRLTRDQYVNSVTDLLADAAPQGASELRGNSVVAGATLPSDERVGPFRSNVVAPPSGLDVQQLMESAERVADTAASRAGAVLGCAPATDGLERCAEAFLDGFGRRAFRRPLHPEERARYRRLFLEAAAAPPAPARPARRAAAEKEVPGEAAIAGRAAEGVRAVVRALVQSPAFLLHTREDGPPAGPDVVRLGPHALASRLSYFLWASAPDDALLSAAARGALDTPEGLRAEARRLLDDDRARRGLVAFHLQWLGVEDVASVQKQAKLFPDWKGAVGGAALGTAFRVETERFVDGVVRGGLGGGRLEALLSAPQSFLDGPLFALYGVAPPAAASPDRPVALDPRQRAGLLTQGSVLAYHAHATQSSPVARGVLIRRHVLCQDLPDPPPDVDSTPPDPDARLTTRERFEEHRESGVCGRCHKLIDPIGFGFEAYDAIGRFRQTENDKPVDATGTIVGTDDLDGDFDGAVDLARRLAGSRQVRRCYVRQWFRFALGREESEADACSLDALDRRFEASGGDIRELLLSLPTTDAFRHRALTR
jgi:hypothetical protein